MPLLSQAGYEVIGLSRGQGADVLDREAVARAVGQAGAGAVVHLATAIPAQANPKTMARDYALTNRLRTEGTANLINAAREAGATQIIVQGLAYAYQPASGLADEHAPLWHNPPSQFAPVLAALIELERLTTQVGGLVLRFGHLYGSGSIYAADGSFTAQVRAGKVPVAGKGNSVFSFTHARDAAAAIAAAIEHPVTGVLNVVDDNPVPISDWLPTFAAMLGAPPPRHVPAFMARLAAGSWGAAFMTQLRGADNTRARQQLSWLPRYPSWSDGFSAELSASAAA
jgi:nucleoside-diphosphate-sugar epimerase